MHILILYTWTCPYQRRRGKFANLRPSLTQRGPTMIPGYHRWATLCKKHEIPWILSIFLHFNAFAISSGSDKYHMQDLSSDLAKEARIRGWAYSKFRNQKFPDKDFRFCETFWTGFCTFGSPRVFSRCFLKTAKKCARKWSIFRSRLGRRLRWISQRRWYGRVQV